MADWKQDAGAFASIAGPFLAILVIDVAIYPYLKPENTPTVILLNFCGFAFLTIGIVWIYLKRWPKADEHTTVETARKHVADNYNAVNIEIKNVESIGGKSRIALEYYESKTKVYVPRMIIVDEGIGKVESDDIDLEAGHY